MLNTPQHDLKGRKPEQSEWLLAEGGAKRNPRYRDTPHDAFEDREYHLLQRLLSIPSLLLANNGENV